MARGTGPWRGSTPEGWERLFREVTVWAEAEPSVRTVLLVGSRARTREPADPLSDADIVLFAHPTEGLIRSVDWFRRFGAAVVSMLESTAVGGSIERRVLYEDGRDVDFAIFDTSALDALVGSAEGRAVLRRGYRVLVDKDRAIPRVDRELRSEPVPGWSPPTAVEFAAVLDDFAYHAVWAAKKLRRGEVWTAKFAVDGYLKRLLLRTLEWRTRAESQGRVDTWHQGRFLERWGDAATLARLRDAFARYEREEVGAALRATMDLFGDEARRAARALGYSFPEETLRTVRGMVEELLPA